MEINTDDNIFSSKHIVAETRCRYFADDIFKCIFLNNNACNSINISLKFVSKVQVNNISSIGSDNGLAPDRCQAII